MTRLQSSCFSPQPRGEVVTLRWPSPAAGSHEPSGKYESLQNLCKFASVRTAKYQDDAAQRGKTEWNRVSWVRLQWASGSLVAVGGFQMCSTSHEKLLWLEVNFTSWNDRFQRKRPGDISECDLTWTVPAGDDRKSRAHRWLIDPGQFYAPHYDRCQK